VVRICGSAASQNGGGKLNVVVWAALNIIIITNQGGLGDAESAKEISK